MIDGIVSHEMAVGYSERRQVSKRLGKTAFDHGHRTWTAIKLPDGSAISCGICACLHFWKDFHGEDQEAREWWRGFNPPRWARLATESISKRIERRKKRAEVRRGRTVEVTC